MWPPAPLTGSLPWPNSILLDGDAASQVARLKQEPVGDLTILGSGELVRSLMAASLIDEFFLMIHRFVLGSGRRLFGDGAHPSLRLVDAITTTKGVVMATYERVR